MQPAAEMEVARLVVEGEESHVDLARGAELGGRRPEHVAGVVDHGEAAHVLAGEVVGAARGGRAREGSRASANRVKTSPRGYNICRQLGSKRLR